MKEASFDFNTFCFSPSSFWVSRLNKRTSEVTNLTFYPLTHYDYGPVREEMCIQAYHISFVDWICMLVAKEKANLDNGTFHISNYLKQEDLDKLDIPSPFADPHSVVKEEIFGNRYSFNSESYKAVFRTHSYSLYFFYINDLKRYVVVKHSCAVA